MFCPTNGSIPCTQVDLYLTQEECESSIACELQNGQVIFGLNSSECRFAIQKFLLKL
jgi:hypothetical protein